MTTLQAQTSIVQIFNPIRCLTQYEATGVYMYYDNYIDITAGRVNKYIYCYRNHSFEYHSVYDNATNISS
jgi:hypothetical protein